MKLASIQEVIDVREHTNADRMEIIRVLGWNVCSRKGEFKAGDKCVYIAIDTILPEKPEFEFLKHQGYKLKTARLRGELSQGVCFPVAAVLPEGDYQVGQDVTEEIGVKKYQKPIPEELFSDVIGPFPTELLNITDEDRIQFFPKLFDEMVGRDVYVSVKYDGTSGTFIHQSSERRRVCGRNWEFKRSETNIFWKIAEKYKIFDRMPMGWAIQFELVGEGIQKNREGIKGKDIRVFNVVELTEFGPRYCGRDEMVSLLQDWGVPRVDEAYCGPFIWNSIEEMLEFASNTKYSNGKPAEGLVWRFKENCYNETLGKDFSVKTISNSYLLKHKE